MICRLFFLTVSTVSVVSFVADGASSADGMALSTAASSGSSIVTLPLVPRHSYVRRLRELGVEIPTQDPTLRRNRHRRRLEDSEEEDDDGEGDAFSSSSHYAQQVGALYQGYGTHYVDLWVGTPAQRQTVIADTGSGVTAFPCSGCEDCGDTYHTDGYFIEANSKTFHKLECDECFRGRCYGSSHNYCRISMSYQEGSSWSAYEARDMTYAGGPHNAALERVEAQRGGEEDGEDETEKDVIARTKKIMDWENPMLASAFAFPLKFGCQTSLTGLFKTQLADGIMGMDNAAAAFWKQMYSSRAIEHKKFAMCFNRQPIAMREGTEAGALTLGGVDSKLHDAPMVYAHNTRSSGFFGVHLRKVYLRENGGESAKADDNDKHSRVHELDISESDLNYGGVIVDSGTTDTYMTRKMAGPFKTLYEKVVGTRFTHEPVELTEEQIRSMPTILFQLAGPSDISYKDYDKMTGLAGSLDPDHPNDIIVAMPATHYMEYDPDDDNYVARFYYEEPSGSVLGANTMMGHDVLFDVEAGVIGWAESRCDYTELISKPSSFPDGTNVTELTEYRKKQESSSSVSFDDEAGGMAEDGAQQMQCGETCRRGVAIVGLLGVVVVGFIVWKRGILWVTLPVRGRSVAYHGTDVEVPVATDDEDVVGLANQMDAAVSEFGDDEEGDLPELPRIT